ncbi:uncharacterized protein LOC142814281 [Rhipicephalus microplus]|uniref:uncharacterized protein LOC142814281 n=1 Tax=Rhipicephalus microplus TaxID=6941 RepID=UPI003F6CF2A5
MDNEASSHLRRLGHDDVRLDATLEDEQGKCVTGRAPHLRVDTISCRQGLALRVGCANIYSRNHRSFLSGHGAPTTTVREESDYTGASDETSSLASNSLGRPARPHLRATSASLLLPDATR